MTLPDSLTQHPHGELRLTGHRIGLEHVVQFYKQGFSPEMLHQQYPTLSLALIHRVIAFYLDNQADVDSYVAQCAATSHSGQRAEFGRVAAAIAEQAAGGEALMPLSFLLDEHLRGVLWRAIQHHNAAA
jgi:uncharacterized protein (DUF433 family)